MAYLIKSSVTIVLKEVNKMEKEEKKLGVVVAIFPRISHFARLTAIRMFKEAGFNCCDIEWHLMPNGWYQAEPKF